MQTKNEKYVKYINESSFPYVMQINGRLSEIREYLAGIYNSIMLKDIVARLKISDVMMLESVVKFVFYNIGSLLSTNKIANTMTTGGRKIDQRTIEKYIKGLSESLMIYQVNRYNVKGKQLLATLDKYYITDIGLRQFLLGGSGADQGHILENVVYLELLRRGYNVYIGHIPDGEVDFVACNNDSINYYQVAATVLDESVMRRELSSLERIKDNHPKFLLSFDDIGAGTNHNGIRQLNAINWLLGE
jgi:predicted AAA+ superfamily ATPase